MHTMRRIAALTAAVGFVSLMLSSGIYLAALCDQGTHSCLAAAVGLSDVSLVPPSPTFTTNASTPVHIPESPSLLLLGLSALQQMGIYALLFGVMALIVLESFELHYLRMIQQRLGLRMRA